MIPGLNSDKEKINVKSLLSDLPISGLPSATTPLDGTEEIAMVQGGVTSRGNASDIQIQIPNLPNATLPLASSDAVLVNQSGDNKKATVADVSFNINTLPLGTTPVAGTEPIPIYQSGDNKQVTIYDVQIDITGLGGDQSAAGSDVFVIEQLGVKYKISLDDISTYVDSAISIDLQKAYDNGSVVNITDVTGIEINGTAAQNSSILKINDFYTRKALDVDCNDTRIQSNYDLELKKSNVGPNPNWGIHGAVTMFKWGQNNASFRAGSCNVSQFDEPNIGNLTFGFGDNIKVTGEKSAAIGSDVIVNSTSVNSFAFGDDIIMSPANSYALGDSINIGGSVHDHIVTIGSNIIVNPFNNSYVTTMGSNINISNNKNNSFTYSDGSFLSVDAISANSFNVYVSNSVNFGNGASANPVKFDVYASDSVNFGTSDSNKANTFNVFTQTSATFNTPSLETTADQFVFDKQIDSSGTYTPCIVHIVGVESAASVGSPLTVGSLGLPFFLRQITAVDPNDQPVVAIALESVGPGGGYIKVCAASLVCLNKQSTETFSKGDFLDKSNSQDGAVKPVIGSSGAFAVAAESSGTGGGIIYAWLKRSEL